MDQTAEPRFPIVVAEGWDLSVFETMGEVEYDFEPEYLEPDTLVSYDCEGRLLRLDTEPTGSKSFFSPTRRLKLTVIEDGHSAALRDLVAGFLEHVPRGQARIAGMDLKAAPISELLEIARSLSK